jgi:transposase InsO family protein
MRRGYPTNHWHPAAFGDRHPRGAQNTNHDAGPPPLDHSAQSVGDALIKVLSQLPPNLRRSLTWDQGNEMFHHERIERETGLRIFFADPHSPWQRGSNENTNGLLRQYFRKEPTSECGPHNNWNTSPMNSTTDRGSA